MNHQSPCHRPAHSTTQQREGGHPRSRPATTSGAEGQSRFTREAS